MEPTLEMLFTVTTPTTVEKLQENPELIMSAIQSAIFRAIDRQDITGDIVIEVNINKQT